MSYQEQLAYLRNKYNLESEKVSEDTTPAWEEVDEQTNEKLKEREERDRWIQDAGMSPVYETPDPLKSRGGREMMMEFDSEFSNHPIVQKYGPRLYEAINQMKMEVENPNTPFNEMQAQDMIKQIIAGMRAEALNDK